MIPTKTPAAAAAQSSSKPETKTVERPKTETYSRGGEKNPRDNNKDSRGGKRDFDSKGKSSNGQQTASRNDDKKKDVDRKDNSDRRKDDSRKKGDNNKKNDKRGGDRNSQPKEFAPVFHGKSADKNPEKLDKFERALLAEEAKNNRSNNNKTESQKKSQQQQSRENSRTDLNHSKQQQNGGYQYYDGRIQGKGGNDQDFGQWNGNNRGQRGREETLANGMQNMNLGDRQQRGGFRGQNGGRADQQQQPPRSGDGGQRGQGQQRSVWQEGQRCMAKYWEVRHNIIQYYKIQYKIQYTDIAGNIVLYFTPAD